MTMTARSGQQGKRRGNESELVPVVRSKLPCNLRSLPFGPTRIRPWMRRLRSTKADARPHDALNGVALTARNSHQINPHLPHQLPGRAARGYRERYLAKECFGSNRLLKRTIATSRSDDNRDEPKKLER